MPKLLQNVRNVVQKRSTTAEQLSGFTCCCRLHRYRWNCSEHSRCSARCRLHLGCLASRTIHEAAQKGDQKTADWFRKRHQFPRRSALQTANTTQRTSVPSACRCYERIETSVENKCNLLMSSRTPHLSQSDASPGGGERWRSCARIFSPAVH